MGVAALSLRRPRGVYALDWDEDSCRFFGRKGLFFLEVKLGLWFKKKPECGSTVGLS
jgi:hypothetical protein